MKIFSRIECLIWMVFLRFLPWIRYSILLDKTTILHLTIAQSCTMEIAVWFRRILSLDFRWFRGMEKKWKCPCPQMLGRYSRMLWVWSVGQVRCWGVQKSYQKVHLICGNESYMYLKYMKKTPPVLVVAASLFSKTYGKRSIWVSINGAAVVNFE